MDPGPELPGLPIAQEAQNERPRSSCVVGIALYVDQTDIAVNLFLRAFLEYNYKQLIEIGAWDGKRAINIKRLLPDLEVFAADIMFTSEFYENGVCFCNFKRISDILSKEGSAILSRGTMAYIEPTELEKFLKMLSASHADLIAWEPVALYRHNKAKKRSFISYYHPYRHILSKSAFKVVSYYSKRISLSMAESYCAIIAKSDIS